MSLHMDFKEELPQTKKSNIPNEKDKQNTYW